MLGTDGDEPVVGCFATQACVDDRPVTRRAHVSGISVEPRRSGRGLATAALQYLEEVLVADGFDSLELHVLRDCGTPVLARSTSTSVGNFSGLENRILLGLMPFTRSGSNERLTGRTTCGLASSHAARLA